MQATRDFQDGAIAFSRPGDSPMSLATEHEYAHLGAKAADQQAVSRLRQLIMQEVRNGCF